MIAPQYTNWLADNEPYLVSLEHRERIENCIRNNWLFAFREFNRSDGSSYKIEYCIGNTWFDALYTTDATVYQKVSNQLERFVRFLKTEVYPDYNPGGFR